MSYLYIFLGGGLGATIRYWTVKLAHLLSNKTVFIHYVHATIIVNFIGCIIYAIMFSLLAKINFSENVKLFVFTGFLASYTTFSTFVFESFDLFYRNGFSAALNYFCLSLLSSFIGFFLIYRLFNVQS